MKNNIYKRKASCRIRRDNNEEFPTFKPIKKISRKSNNAILANPERARKILSELSLSKKTSQRRLINISPKKLLVSSPGRNSEKLNLESLIKGQEMVNSQMVLKTPKVGSSKPKIVPSFAKTLLLNTKRGGEEVQVVQETKNLLSREFRGSTSLRSLKKLTITRPKKSIFLSSN